MVLKVLAMTRQKAELGEQNYEPDSWPGAGPISQPEEGHPGQGVPAQQELC